MARQNYLIALDQRKERTLLKKIKNQIGDSSIFIWMMRQTFVNICVIDDGTDS